MNPHRLHGDDELSEMLMSADPAERERAALEMNTAQQARLLRHLYSTTRNGMAVWRLLALYRRAGLPVPDDVMQALDGFAASLEVAHAPPAIAKAIGLSGDLGGAQGASALRKASDRALRLQDVAGALYAQRSLPASERKPDAWVIARIAAQRGESAGAVKKAWLDAVRQSRRKPAAAIDAALAAHLRAPAGRVIRRR